MRMTPPPTGSLVALATPFQDRQLDTDTLAALAERQIVRVNLRPSPAGDHAR